MNNIEKQLQDLKSKLENSLLNISQLEDTLQEERKNIMTYGKAVVTLIHKQKDFMKDKTYSIESQKYSYSVAKEKPKVHYDIPKDEELDLDKLRRLLDGFDK